MNTVQYKVYSIKYERLDEKGIKRKIAEDFFLRKEERDYIFHNGSSKIYINVFPAESKGLFHGWNMPERCIKTKHTYLCEEPSQERKETEYLTAEDYKVEELKNYNNNIDKIENR